MPNASLDQIRDWIKACPAPDCAAEPGEVEAWLYRLWFFSVDADGRTLDDPAEPYLDWLDRLCRDEHHPAADLARIWKTWSEPGLPF